MRNRIIVLFCALVILLLPVIASAQTPAPAPDLNEPYWTVSIHGQYTDVSGAQTNNGTKSGAELRFAQHWTGEAAYYTTISPSTAKIAQVGPNYYFSPAHLFKPGSSQFLNLQAFQVHFGPSVGMSMQNGTKKFAWGIGGGIDREVSPNVTLRLIDVRYLRAAVLPNGGQLVGNHVAVGAGLGLRF